MVSLVAATVLGQSTFEVGPATGKRIVLIGGDEEYRSEEMLPQLARILSDRHGFRCAVVLSQNANGEIDPENQTSAPGISALDKADLCIFMIRFRHYSDADMGHFVRYFESGKPIIAIRTSTHPFQYPKDSYSPYRLWSWDSKQWPGGFGKQVLGERWVSHWGNHGVEATRGVPVLGHPILAGVDGLFGTTDVYEAAPPPDAKILMRGEVLRSLDPKAPAATGLRKTRTGAEQGLNEPMMPIVWTREVPNRVVTTTFGSATDFLDDRFRGLLVNATFWGLKKQVPLRADVRFVGDYRPSPFGFGKFKRGVRIEDL
ncbi:MAG: ThuA domain-containing protein [Armatimonadota bacterium]